MGINRLELLDSVIKPLLKDLQIEAVQAEALLLGAARRSHMGRQLRSAGGERMGIYGISSDQHRQLWDCYLCSRPELASAVRGLASQRAFLQNPDSELITNLSYATAIAWLLIDQQLCQSPQLGEKLHQQQSQQQLLEYVFNNRAPCVAA